MRLYTPNPRLSTADRIVKLFNHMNEDFIRDKCVKFADKDKVNRNSELNEISYTFDDNSTVIEYLKDGLTQFRAVNPEAQNINQLGR